MIFNTNDLEVAPPHTRGVERNRFAVATVLDSYNRAGGKDKKVCLILITVLATKIRKCARFL